MASYAPAFGMVGTLVGLVNLMFLPATQRHHLDRPTNGHRTDDHLYGVLVGLTSSSSPSPQLLSAAQKNASRAYAAW